MDEGRGRATIAVNYNCLLVHAESGVVLIDTGLGEQFLGYGRELSPHLGHLRASLALAGVSPGGVRKVIFTHLHQDHVRGSIWSGVPTFTNAEHLASAAEVALWTSTAAGAGSVAPEADQARAALATLRPGPRSTGFDEAINPEIRTVDASGHTPGHVALLIRSGSDRLLRTDGLFYDPLQLRHTEWSTPDDVDRPASIAVRCRLVSWAADEQVPFTPTTCPFLASAASADEAIPSTGSPS